MQTPACVSLCTRDRTWSGSLQSPVSWLWGSLEQARPQAPQCSLCLELGSGRLWLLPFCCQDSLSRGAGSRVPSGIPLEAARQLLEPCGLSSLRAQVCSTCCLAVPIGHSWAGQAFTASGDGCPGDVFLHTQVRPTGAPSFVKWTQRMPRRGRGSGPDSRRGRPKAG